MNFQEFIQTEEGQAGARKWQELGKKQGWTDQEVTNAIIATFRIMKKSNLLQETKPMTNFFMVMCATGIFYLGFDGALTDMTRNDCAAGVQAACEVLR